MTGFSVCQRVCHSVEISGEVQSAFNQARDQRANGSLFVSCLCGGWAAIRMVPFFFCYESLESVYLMFFFSKETFFKC